MASQDVMFTYYCFKTKVNQIPRMMMMVVVMIIDMFIVIIWFY